MSDHIKKLEKLTQRLDKQVPLEVLLRALIELQCDGFAVVDNETMTFYSTTPTFAHVFGYRQDELVGRSIERIIPPEIHGKHREHVAMWMRHPRSLRMDARATVRGMRRDGKELRLKVGVSPINSSQTLVMIKVLGPGQGGGDG